MLSYYNKDEEPLYILHFPGDSFSNDDNIKMFKENADRKVSISDKISIISIMNKECFDTSALIHQSEISGFDIINTAIDEEKWNNTIKIKHIIKCLEAIKTEYAVITDGRDVVFCYDLQDEFLETVNAFKSPIIFNATPFQHPSVMIETLQDLLKESGTHKYLNAGVCVGKTDKLLEFYRFAQKINEEHPDNSSEQYIIRLAKKYKPNDVCVDSKCKLFRIVHHSDTIHKIKDNKNILI